MIVKFNPKMGETLSSEILRVPGSWQMITRGEGIGPLTSISLRVLKVSLEL